MLKDNNFSNKKGDKIKNAKTKTPLTSYSFYTKYKIERFQLALQETNFSEKVSSSC